MFLIEDLSVFFVTNQLNSKSTWETSSMAHKKIMSDSRQSLKMFNPNNSLRMLVILRWPTFAVIRNWTSSIWAVLVWFTRPDRASIRRTSVKYSTKCRASYKSSSTMACRRFSRWPAQPKRLLKWPASPESRSWQGTSLAPRVGSCLEIASKSSTSRPARNSDRVKSARFAAKRRRSWRNISTDLRQVFLTD